MIPSEQLVQKAIAHAQPYRYVVQQARCRACGQVHEREIGLMHEHAPGSWVRVVEASLLASHQYAPVEFVPVELAWCDSCHAPSAAELTREARLAIDRFANTIELEKALRAALARFEAARRKEQFHHAGLENDNASPSQH